jgi:hypothetical protein
MLKDKVIQLKSTITVLREERLVSETAEKGPQTKSAPEAGRSASVKRDTSKGSRK